MEDTEKEFIFEDPHGKYSVRAKTMNDANNQVNRYIKYGWFPNCQVKVLK